MPNETSTAPQLTPEDGATGVRGFGVAKFSSRILLIISWFLAICIFSLNLQSTSECERDLIGCVPSAKSTQSVPGTSQAPGPKAVQSASPSDEIHSGPTSTKIPAQQLILPSPTPSPASAVSNSKPKTEPHSPATPLSQFLSVKAADVANLYSRRGPSRAIELLMLAVVVAPYLIGWWIFWILKFALYTITYRLQVPSYVMTKEGYWAERARGVQFSWDYESLGRDRSQVRAKEYAHLLGWLASLALGLYQAIRSPS